MKIAIIGTSNSIIKSGYLETYKALEYPNQVDSFSLGGSVISYAAFALEYYNILNNYDIIITEFSGNDSFRCPNFISTYCLYTYIYDIFAIIHQANKIHINLIFDRVRSSNNEDIINIYRTISKKFNVINIEVDKIIHSATKNSVNIWTEDTAHYKEEYIKLIAYLIKKQREKSIHNSIQKNLQPVRKFYIQKAKEISSLPLKYIGTTLYQFQACCISKQQKIFPPYPNMNIEGFLYYKNIAPNQIIFSNSQKNKYILNFDIGAGYFHYYYFNKQNENDTQFKLDTEFELQNISYNDNTKKIQYNSFDFELIALVYSEKIKDRTYPPLTVDTTYNFDEDLQEYIKIFSLTKKIEQNQNLINLITNIDLLITIKSVITNKSLSLSILKRIFILSGYNNPYLLYNYIILSDFTNENKNDEIEKIFFKFLEYKNTTLSFMLFDHFIEKTDCYHAEIVFNNLIHINKNISFFEKNAKLNFLKKDYNNAVSYFLKCRKINENSQEYINYLLLCYLKLHNNNEIKKLLEELFYKIEIAKKEKIHIQFNELQQTLTDILQLDNFKEFHIHIKELKNNNFRT